MSTGNGYYVVIGFKVQETGSSDNVVWPGSIFDLGNVSRSCPQGDLGKPILEWQWYIA